MSERIRVARRAGAPPVRASDAVLAFWAKWSLTRRALAIKRRSTAPAREARADGSVDKWCAAARTSRWWWSLARLTRRSTSSGRSGRSIGAQVVYGVVGLTHAKMLLVTRRENRRPVTLCTCSPVTTTRCRPVCTDISYFSWRRGAHAGCRPCLPAPGQPDPLLPWLHRRAGAVHAAPVPQARVDAIGAAARRHAGAASSSRRTAPTDETADPRAGPVRVRMAQIDPIVRGVACCRRVCRS